MGVTEAMTTLALLVATLALRQDAPPKTAASVDLQRYAGRWFEIARFPNRFQRDCKGDVVVFYTMRSDGRLDVDNRCRRTNGSTNRAVGVARLATGDGSNSKLEVRFAPAWLSWLAAVCGDYWIVGLEAGYQLAVVGSPDREYLWVLSRSPSPPEADVTRLIAIAREQGFDVTRLEPTSQSGEVPQAE